MFIRFQSNFHKLTVDDLTDLFYDTSIVENDCVITLIVISPELAKFGVCKVRENENELLDLPHIYLIGSVTNIKRFRFKQPEVLHKVSQITSFKNTILSELPKGAVLTVQS